MLLDLVKKRRSIRKFTDEKVSDEDIKKILEVALHAPTAKNRNPIRYIVIKDRDRLEKLSNFKVGTAKLLARAGAAIAVVSDKSIAPNTYFQDASIAATFILLAVADYGLGATWVNVVDAVHESGVSSKEYLREFFDLEDNFDVECVIGIGHTAEEKSEKIPFDYRDNVFEDLNDKVK